MMHFLLVSYLPFDAQDSDRLRRNEKIIQQVLEEDIQTDQEWWKEISSEGKKLLARFLDKNPNTRITIDDAMKDTWFDEIREEAASMQLPSPPSPGYSPPMSPDCAPCTVHNFSTFYERTYDLSHTQFLFNE